MWISAGTLAVGNYGPGNSLTITNGGMVSNAIGAIGAWAPSSGNILMVAGSNSQWLGSYDLLAGYEGNTNRLCLSAGGRLSAAYTTIGEAPAAIGNTAIATDSGTLLTNAWALIVGHCGSANTLLVTNAARVAHRYGFIGVETNAGGNQVTVAGACWTTFSNLTIGVDGHDNALMIVNSGQVRSAVGILGDYDDGIGNQVIISGAGALWTNSGTLTVGNDGSGNQVVITNDGQLVCAASMIGYGPHAGGNAVVLTGTNAMWSGFTNLVIGNGGTGNIVRISQGAFLTNRQTWIGFTVTAAS
jgi:T5SS/PEP-CTERM-associated repeat protein